MKIFVTGGLGFIGSNFIIHQMQTNPEFTVFNVDKMGLGANSINLKNIQGKPRYKLIKSDISKKLDCKNLFYDIDVVVNFAAETHVDRSISDPEPFIESNILGTYNLLETERKIDRDIKHIKVSTDEVYGDILSGSHKEDDIMQPSNPYSASKGAADLICLSYARTYGLDIIITRCTNNFGPRQFPEKLIPKTIHRALNNKEIPIYGTGKNKRDWLYVKDHCRALRLLMNKGEKGEIYNISAGNEFSVNQIVKMILDYMDKPMSLIKYMKDRPGHDVRYSLDSSKIRELGWKPEYPFNEALIRTIKWYEDNPDWWKEYNKNITAAP
jgi:dTDP-glucose 4,6-dehydratase